MKHLSPVPVDQLEDQPETPVVPNMDSVEESLAILASAPTLPAYTKTRNVREQFQHAFDMIGGVPRLAHWAHANPAKFYALYSKLIPVQLAGDPNQPIRLQLSWVNGRDTSGRQIQGSAQIIDVPPNLDSNGRGPLSD